MKVCAASVNPTELIPQHMVGALFHSLRKNLTASATESRTSPLHENLHFARQQNAHGNCDTVRVNSKRTAANQKHTRSPKYPEQTVAEDHDEKNVFFSETVTGDVDTLMLKFRQQNAFLKVLRDFCWTRTWSSLRIERVSFSPAISAARCTLRSA